MQPFDTLLQTLIDLCTAEQIFPVDDLASLVDHNLFELGLVDSLSLTLLRTVIEEAFCVPIPEEMFVAELHSLRDAAVYIADAQPALA